MAILSTFSRTDLETVMSEGDARGLSRVPGLGLKGAQKIILELRGKIDFEVKDGKDDGVIKELKSALRSLGFSGDSLQDKVDIAEKLIKEKQDIEIEELIKAVLSQ